MKPYLLLVEDDLTVRAMLDETLHFLGYDVVTARDGAEALKCIAESQAKGRVFDLVLTDHQMPVLSGLGLVRELRAQNYVGRVYVLSGAMAAEARKEYSLLQVAGVAMKPVDMRELYRFLSANQNEAESCDNTVWRGR